MERKYKEKHDEWLRREDEKEKERKRDREREKDKEKSKYKLVQKELEFDPEEETKRKSKLYTPERKKYRTREFAEDEQERKREIYKDNPPEPTALDDELPPLPEDENEAEEEG